MSTNSPVELSIEQQFSIRSFETQVEKMSLEQAQQFLVQLYKQMMMREATYKHLLKHQWGLEQESYTQIKADWQNQGYVAAAEEAAEKLKNLTDWDSEKNDTAPF